MHCSIVCRCFPSIVGVQMTKGSKLCCFSSDVSKPSVSGEPETHPDVLWQVDGVVGNSLVDIRSRGESNLTLELVRKCSVGVLVMTMLFNRRLSETQNYSQNAFAGCKLGLQRWRS